MFAEVRAGGSGSLWACGTCYTNQDDHSVATKRPVETYLEGASEAPDFILAPDGFLPPFINSSK